MRRNKGSSAINIIGLATGIITCLLIVLYVQDELSFDRYNLKADRIYRVGHEVKFGGTELDLAQAPAGMGPATVREFPQVEQYTRFSWHPPITIKKGNQNLRESKVTFADSALFDVFTLPMISGDPRTALKEPRSIVLTETMAQKYFNTPDAAGQTVLINGNEHYKVTGVIRDIPRQSHFNYDFFLPMCENEDSRNEADGWISENYNTYLLFKKGTDAESVLPQFDKMLDRYVAPVLKSTMNLSMTEFSRQGSYVRNNITPLTSIHLYSDKLGELAANGDIAYVYIFSAIAAFILIIACVNFMNLSTARSANRAKEVGVRKVLGSDRKHLIAQFLTESLLISVIALLVAFSSTLLLLPWFNNVAGKHINAGVLLDPSMLIFLFALTLTTGLLAGSYPAFVLSAFQPIKVLKGKPAGGPGNYRLRNLLVVFQFAISIILIVGTLVIHSQLAYIRNKDVGFNREQILIIENTNVLNTQTLAFRNELSNIPGVVDATMTGYLPVKGDRSSDAFFTSPSLDPKTSVLMQKWTVDENYLPTLDIKIVSGRNFSRDFPSDSNAVIINQAAAKLLGSADPVNKRLYRIVDMKTKKVTTHNIVGVVKNFNFNSLRDMITPLALRFGNDNNGVAVRVDPRHVDGTISRIRNLWEAATPADPFIYSFMDEEFNESYGAEQRTGKLFVAFATLAIMIACLGLFGLAAYAAQQRNKEIGIRKVLGASAGIIAVMLSKDFLKPVLIAALIGSPIAWFLMNNWLQDFAFRTDISWWFFVVAASLAAAIAFVTVVFHAIKAAVTNPVHSLRIE